MIEFKLTESQETVLFGGVLEISQRYKFEGSIVTVNDGKVSGADTELFPPNLNVCGTCGERYPWDKMIGGKTCVYCAFID